MRSRTASFAAGVVLVLVGLPMLICPGPGIGTILAGVAMIAYGLTGKRGEPKAYRDPGPPH